MKKLLLLAACTVALSMNAQETYPKMTKVWSVDVTSLASAECRQGVALNGKWYINNKAEEKVYVVSETGIAAETLPGTTNCGISKDQAGNLVLSTAAFPNNWAAEHGFKVYNPATPETVTTLTLTPDLVEAVGRCDYISKAAGDLTKDGTIIVHGNKNTGLGFLVVVDGETSEDESYVATCEGITFANMTVSHPITNAEGEIEKVLHVTRNAAPAFLEFDGDNMAISRTLSLANKGASNGADIITVGEKTLLVIPSLPNYMNAFGVYDITEVADSYSPIVAYEATVAANPNGVQANWLYFEPVDNNNVKVMQYVPGLEVACFNIQLQEASGVNDVTTAKSVSSVRYYNIAGQESTSAFEGVNVVVTTYTDGSQKAVKVVK